MAFICDTRENWYYHHSYWIVVQNCFFFLALSRKTVRREEFRFLLYDTLLAGFSTVVESSPDSKFWPSLPPSPPSSRKKGQLVLSYQRFPPLLPSHTHCCWRGGRSRRGSPRPSPESSSRTSGWHPPRSQCCRRDSRRPEDRTSGNSCPRDCLQGNTRA